MDVSLSSTSVMRLMRPVNGRGGFQQLLRKLQLRLQGSVLTVDPDDCERLARYSSSYGTGGFQARTTGAASETQQSFDFGA